MHYLVTGGAGFIGSSLVDRLLSLGHTVTAFDNFSTGLQPFVENARKNPNYKLVEGDLLDEAAIQAAAKGVDFIFHLAANADVRFGTQHPRKDLEQNTIATFNVLEAARLGGAKGLAFSSTGSVYGEATVIPTPEDAPFPIQTSLYAASKLAGEGMLAAYTEGFGLRTFIFRFVSILGPRYTHGHVYDFYRKLSADPSQLTVLGDGKQKKSYLHIDDCISAMLTVVEKSKDKVSVYNLGTDEYCEIVNSIGWICEEMGVKPKLSYTGGERGWIGDNPFIYLDTKKVRSLGWKPQFSIEQGVRNTLNWLKANDWVYEQRG
ncbi:MAG: NAD-dependent epimerase/dehydratase family protein [Alphaproteobacteria bacterium]